MESPYPNSISKVDLQFLLILYFHGPKQTEVNTELSSYNNTRSNWFFMVKDIKGKKIPQ